MKKFVLALAAAMMAMTALAQTPEEILGRMSEVMSNAENKGLSMTMTIKIPILGSMNTHAYTLGDKSRIEVKAMGKEMITWDDGKTSWEYNPKDNEITIEDAKTGKKSETEENMGLATGVTEGYDIKLVKETDQYWAFRCTRSKDNPNKDDPKKMDISVWKDSYLLRELKATVKGITVVMSDVSFDVQESDVIFDINKFPGAKIIDKRGEEKEQK